MDFMRRYSTPRTWWVLAVLLLASSRIGFAEVLPSIKGEVEANVLARGLQNPDGIAVHPQTQAIYVSERGAGRISVIQNGTAVPVTTSGWTVEDNLPDWAPTSQKTAEAWKANRLESPGAIAISTNGHLFVAEFIPRGRILEFIPDAQGKFTKVNAVPVPWLDKPYAWDDLKVSKADRLYVAGSDAESLGGAKFGSVLVREPNGDWWAADYGPFVDYSSICYSEDQDVLVTAERPNGTLTWWDAYRHMVIGQITNLTPASEIECIALLADGAIAVAKKASPG